MREKEPQESMACSLRAAYLEIDSLEKQRDQLREALGRTLHNFEMVLSQSPVREADETIVEARTALSETKEATQ